MELVDGETLAAKLTRGAPSTTEVLKIGGEIADALDRAHRAGVVHRDLKPGNIMITKSGAKLMDFGLARATGLGGPPTGGATVGSFAQSPTVAQPLTAEGAIAGTFEYMSPEQLEGREADPRSDLWSLGCVLYEMTTGQRAFDGATQASLISSIMRDQPRAMSSLAPLSPPGLDRLVQACLAKDLADRLQSAHDIRMQLAWTLAAAGLMAAAALVWITLRARRPDGLPLAFQGASEPRLGFSGTQSVSCLRLVAVVECGRRVSLPVGVFRAATGRGFGSLRRRAFRGVARVLWAGGRAPA